MAVKPHDPERQKRIDKQADTVANLIGVDPETVMTDGNYGVSLTPDQMDLLFLALTGQGYQNAIDLLKATGEAAQQEGADHNLTKWAVLVSAADFLEGVK